MSERVLMKGNEAIGEAAIRAGCLYYFGYPITPQSEIPEYMAKQLPQRGGVYLQAESEVAAVNMVYGAAACGVRSMTSSSSPGFSLKQEGISYIAAAELPCLLVNVQRGGPGLGTIQPGQADYFQATKGGGHGDYRLLVLAPNSVQEMFDLTILGFELADKYRIPALLLADGALGQMMEAVSLEVSLQAKPEKQWAVTGRRGRVEPNVVKTLCFDQDTLEEHNRSLQRKYKLLEQQEVRYEELHTEDAELILVAYGISARLARSAVMQARAKGLRVGLFRPITLFPFPEEALFQLTAKNTQAFLVVELSAGQMIEDVERVTRRQKPVHFHGRTGGNIPTVDEIYDQIVQIMNKGGN
ncbi:Ketoisovalerate oxidoreductase subunit VorB [uncultured Sporomusa sp.]|uniref:Ketoisovalerate oxidoreductase subunit VorB n=1 Tax=uncultured Sporomusa sp. TaxID=307249 RepID=A0A212M231_9FIRM|nr:3-methyl-2-oxobutanoate dehydrogenase subunit VorB [uncultured Sporomusa sp.]SCM83759.1 Ketoisovalerate oxidoreductase subunit VorB [uncultured Sporomusa sp.]